MMKISQNHNKAVELHNKILVSAQLAQNNLWDMCSGLKEMRDGKLYKELGYQNFEEYCGAEFNMSRRNAYHYISILENMKPENVKTFSHFGKSKLFLLSTLSEENQQKITAENDVESMTVKQLEAQIKQLKSDNDRLSGTNADIKEQLDIAREDYRNVHQEKLELRKQVAHLKDEIDVLEARPVEVAVAEPSDDVRRLKETIKSLERSTESQLEQMQNEHIEDIRKLHMQRNEEMEKALEAQRREYEEKLVELENRADGDSEENTLALLDVYYKTAHDALFNLLSFASCAMDKTACFTKIKTLLVEYEKLNDELVYGR